jgi:hypothetical protein
MGGERFGFEKDIRYGGIDFQEETENSSGGWLIRFSAYL